MNAKEFNKALADALGITQAEAATRLSKLIEVFRQNLGEQKSINLQNFGTFSVKKSEMRKGYSPILKKYVFFPPKKVLVFHPSSHLKEFVKNI